MADPISGALKSAIEAAADAHLASVTADVNRVKAAVQSDLPSVSATAVDVAALVKAEVAKIKADVGSVWKPWMTGVAIAVASVGAAVGLHLAHVF